MSFYPTVRPTGPYTYPDIMVVLGDALTVSLPFYTE